MQSIASTPLSALPASPTDGENAASNIRKRPTSAIPTTSFSSDFFGGPSKIGVTLSLPPDFHAPSPRIKHLALTPVSLSVPPDFAPTPTTQKSTIPPTFVPTDTTPPPNASSTPQFVPTQAAQNTTITVTFTTDTTTQRTSNVPSGSFINPSTSNDLAPTPASPPSTTSSSLSIFNTNTAIPRSSSSDFGEKTESNPTFTIGAIISSAPISSPSSSTRISLSHLSSRSSPTHPVIIAIVVCSGIVFFILLAGVFFCTRTQSRRRMRERNWRNLNQGKGR